MVVGQHGRAPPTGEEWAEGEGTFPLLDHICVAMLAYIRSSLVPPEHPAQQLPAYTCACVPYVRAPQALQTPSRVHPPSIRAEPSVGWPKSVSGRGLDSQSQCTESHL